MSQDLSPSGEVTGLRLPEQQDTWGSRLCSSCRVEWLGLGSRQEEWRQQVPWQLEAVQTTDIVLSSLWE